MESQSTAWIAVVAVAKNGVIGRDGDLPWRLSSDLRRFKERTMGHCLLMGRKTFESIGRPLPGRQTIVLSRSGYSGAPESVRIAEDIASVDQLVEPGRRVMVVGGAQIYASALSRCSELWITRVLADVTGDTQFPEIDWNDWQQIHCEPTAPGPKDDFATEFQIWRRLRES